MLVTRCLVAFVLAILSAVAAGVEPAAAVVVEQQTHAHPALRRLPERLEQEEADLVRVPDVVLLV